MQVSSQSLFVNLKKKKKKKPPVTYVEHTSVHLSVTWYQHVNCLSDFHEMWYRVLYKEFCCEHEFCIN